MEKETLNNILSFIEKVDGAKIPFLWKITNGSPLTKDELNIDDDLDLSNFKITSLPEGLKVSGNLILDYSKITSLPEGLEVGGDLYINKTPLTKYSDYELKEMVKLGFIKGDIIR